MDIAQKYECIRRTDRGFTLVELLVVIAIIGILSSVVMTSLGPARESSRDARRQTDLQQISLALEMFNDTCGSYPSAGSVTAIDGGGLTHVACPNSETLSDFMDIIPDDPQGNSYQYIASSGEDTYCLGTNLEGGAGKVPDNDDVSCHDGSNNPIDLGEGINGGDSSADYAISR